MNKMTWKDAGMWCPDYKTHDYIVGDDADAMIENAEEHLKEVHPYEWSKMTSQNVAALHFAIKAHFPQEAANDNASAVADEEDQEEAA